MDLFTIFEKAKTAKQRGKKYGYPGTPVKFEFRSLTVGEGRAIAKIIKAAESAPDFEGVDKIMEEIIKMNPLVGWEGMTKGLLEEISSLKLEVPEEEKDQPIEYQEDYSQRMLATCIGYNGEEIKNIPFLNFMSEAIKDAAESKRIEAEAQKKM